MVPFTQQRVQSGARRKIAVHVGVIRKEPVGNPTRRHFSFGIHYLLIMGLIDIPPERLCMPDEVHLRKFFQYPMEPFNVKIVRLMLEMEQHWHMEMVSDRSHQFDMFGIAVHSELLFADTQRS